MAQQTEMKMYIISARILHTMSSTNLKFVLNDSKRVLSKTKGTTYVRPKGLVISWTETVEIMALGHRIDRVICVPDNGWKKIFRKGLYHVWKRTRWFSKKGPYFVTEITQLLYWIWIIERYAECISVREKFKRVWICSECFKQKCDRAARPSRGSHQQNSGGDKKAPVS